MSKLDELIEKLCPNGVKYVSLSNIFDNFSGMTGVSNKWKETGNCQFIEYMNAYNNLKIKTNLLPFATVKKLEQNTLKKGDILLTSASETPDECALSSVIEDEIQDNIFMDDHLFGIRLNNEYKDKINPIFINYYMHTKKFRKQVNKTVRGVTRFYISVGDFMKICIPVPPLEVQREIAHILDDFTLLSAEISAEISAELKSRKEQYEYYKNKLLEPQENWSSISMEELCEIITKQTGFDYSATIKPALVNEKNENTLSFIQNKDFNGEYFNYDTDYYIPEYIVKRFPKITLDKPSILFSISGKIGNVGLFDKRDRAFIGGAICICKLKEKSPIINKYILYYSQSKYGQKYLLKSIKAASHLNITVESIRNMKIFYPSKEEQEKIIERLCKLDKLCNGLSEVLPAEIEARKKQYEYYRDKLLNFKELEQEN